MGWIVIFDHWDQVSAWVGSLAASKVHYMHGFWPGKTTFVVPASTEAPASVVHASDTIALRMVGNDLARRLCALTGANYFN